jgi:hypothetical protein
MMMFHKGCGGVLVPNMDKLYEYVTEDGVSAKFPAIFCDLCKKEILGDREIHLSDDEGVIEKKPAKRKA